MRNIAVLTSGGDAPGMNACVRSVVRCGIAAGARVYGVRRGYAGLISGDLFEMNSRSVGGIMKNGGTILMSARSKDFREDAGQRKAISNMKAYGIDGLIVVGGDGSLTGALALHKLGFPVIGVPASIDNDIALTEMSIGVDTALNTIVDAVDKIKDTASAHQRAFIIEVMGRRHGYLALMAGVAGGAERVILPNTHIDPKEIEEDVKRAFVRGKPHYIMIVAEGANMGDINYSTTLCNELDDAGYEPRITVLGHVQRGGAPTVFDRLLGTRFGAKAVEELINGNSAKMTALQADAIVSADLEQVLSTPASIREDMIALAGPLAM